jgi:pimeloyl-ACP methyl ester carboxylesterase
LKTVRVRRLGVLVAVLAIAGCSGDVVSTGDIKVIENSAVTSPGTSRGTSPATTPAPGGSTASPDTTSASNDTLGWSDCGNGEQCAKLDVPRDYADPSKGTLALFIKRLPAAKPDQRIGSLLVNPGGPGAAGSLLADYASGIYSGDLLDHFDIVAWDPRGTGASHSVDCVPDNDPYVSLDPIPETPAKRQALEKAGEDLAAACERNSADILPYVSTEASARDMDRIRQALGEPKISYFGFSYGSELGAVWATLFPTTVRAAVLDGAVNPDDTPAQLAVAQAKGFELAFTHFLDRCKNDAKCPFNNGGNPAGTYDKLFASLDTKPLPSAKGRPPVNQGVTELAVAEALYSEPTWPILEDSLAKAQRGDGSGLLALYDEYRLAYGENTLESLLAINCLDTGPTPPDQQAATDAELAQVAPHFQGTDALTIACGHWPVPPVPPVKITGIGAGPIVVVGTTGDPATPLESTRGMAKALEGGRLIVNDAEGHTGYEAGTCVGKFVDRYLIDHTVPDDGTTCTN